MIKLFSCGCIGLFVSGRMIWLKLTLFIKQSKCRYTEQKKKRNDRPPRIFNLKGKTLIISGLLLYDSNSWDIRVYHAKKMIFVSIKIE